MVEASTMRLIDADALLQSYDVAWMVEYDETGCGVSRKAIPVKSIEEAPTIEAEPVRHGRWFGWHGDKRCKDGEYRHFRYYECSECGRRSDIKTNYCPNCGAKMDGGADT